ncbi:sporulation related protein [Tumebacillus sp. BK434]|uniref:SPOR domain-containing protein n=1 Tax=Tumebacillus sp. BK434 TaxID=2512169 RepID=UPI001048563A|nr:SPOR domain-containing protein [Tumebacillus sp. BK434]TCP59678.1 sporulation related protein [Tumebacillus sp. BK434]
MDKPQINVHIKSKSTSKADACTRFPSRLQRGLKSSAGKGRILFPLLLATLTGVLLGVCLLLLFKGQTASGIVSATSPDAPAAQPGGVPAFGAEAELPGVSLYAMQIGVFKDRARAEALQAAVADKGVGTVIRGTEQFQVFTAVTADKAAGKQLEAALKDLEIQHYPKEFIIEARSGKLTGVAEADAKTITTGIAKELQLAAAIMPLALEPSPDASKAKALAPELAALDGELKNWQTILAKANRTEEKVLLEKMHGSLSEAVKAVQEGRGMFAAQVKLTAFYLGYESLVSNLLKSE